MLESTESLLPKSTREGGRARLKTFIIGLEEYGTGELRRLLDTLGVEVVGELVAAPRKISPATYISSGKLEASKGMIEHLGAEAVFVDVELSPNQLRNIEKILGIPTLDRPGVILEIFSQHAKTKESKTQVELAKLEYVLPRLAHMWSHFERQRGGGVGNRGMGERQIEVDRRLVKKRMQILRGRLAEIEKERKIQRAHRRDVLQVALVGYTNAGKSTLLNALTHSNVLAENKLFATLDASVRMLSPDSHPPVVAVDTVGFVSRLPHGLVASFRSTLEEVHEADFLVHVVDASSPTAKEELKVTEDVMKELGADTKPRMVVLNKMDLVEANARKEEETPTVDGDSIAALRSAGATRSAAEATEALEASADVARIGPSARARAVLGRPAVPGAGAPSRVAASIPARVAAPGVSSRVAARNAARLIHPGAQAISALNPEEVKKLRELILGHFKNQLAIWEVVIPYSESRLEALVHAHGSVESAKHIEKGTFIRVRMEDGWAKKLGLEKFRT